METKLISSSGTIGFLRETKSEPNPAIENFMRLDTHFRSLRDNLKSTLNKVTGDAGKIEFF